MSKVYYADCDSPDNCRTGYHATPESALEAFRRENLAIVGIGNVYITECDGEDPDVIAIAKYLSGRGVDSPAIAE